MDVKYKLSGDELAYTAAMTGAPGLFGVDNGWGRYSEQRLEEERTNAVERLCAAGYAELDFELNLALDAELARLADIVGSCSTAISFDARPGADDARHTVFYRKGDEFCSADAGARGEYCVAACSLEDIASFADEFASGPKDEDAAREPMAVSTRLLGELNETRDPEAFMKASGLGERAKELSDAILSSGNLRVVTVFFKSDGDPATAELVWLDAASGAYGFETDYSTMDEVARFTPLSRDDRKKLASEIVGRYMGDKEQ